MRRYQKILALTLVGTGAFMLPGTLPVQAATVQADSVQADAAVHSLQKVTAVTRVYGSGEQAKHECIILAPQYTANLVDKIGMMTTDENVWVTLSQHQPWQLWGICMKTGWA